MSSLDKVGASASTVLSPMVQLHRLAALGAILICVGIVLNIDPFAKAPSITQAPLKYSEQTAAANVKQLDTVSSLPQPDVDARLPPQGFLAGAEPEQLPGSVRALMEPSPFTVAEAAPYEPASSDIGGGEIDSREAAADPATQPQPDHANVERPTIVGVWAPDAGTCSARDFQDGVLPTVINNEGAWAGDTFCLFTNKKQTETGWTVVAKCSTPRERWTSKVRFMVTESRLKWVSKRGVQTYTRCAPDVLMAQAK